MYIPSESIHMRKYVHNPNTFFPHDKNVIIVYLVINESTFPSFLKY